MDSSKVKMASYKDENGKSIKGIEYYVPNTQYETEAHTKAVVQDISDNWLTLSRNGKFHVIFATSSINEAIKYYRLMKVMLPKLKVTALFDPNIDNNGNFRIKEDGLVEIIIDYNEMYKQSFAIPTFAKMKKDIAARLAHKKPYERIEREPEKQIDLLIVVDQMLTGFDSKWVNTLYLDKVLKYENIIQAFSRTNRLFGHEKPFGTIRYYRKPHTMDQNISDAVKLYSGDKPLGLFVQHLTENLVQVNIIFESITLIFANSGIDNFEKLPDDVESRKKFAKDFNQLNIFLESAKIQGFTWDKSSYTDEVSGEIIYVSISKNTYEILILRYKELKPDDHTPPFDDMAPYDLESYITEMDTGVIDSDYMNSRFDKYLKLLRAEDVSEEDVERAESELNKTFAMLTQEEQKYAYLFLHDIQRGDVNISPDKTLRDYINDYMLRAKTDEIHQMALNLGLDEQKLTDIMSLKLNDSNLNEFGRYDELKQTVDKTKAKEYFERIEGVKLIPPKVSIKTDKLLREFILRGGMDSTEAEEEIE